MSDGTSEPNARPPGVRGWAGKNRGGLAVEQLADYWKTVCETLCHPARSFTAPQAVAGSGSGQRTGSAKVLRRDRFSWKLLVFVLINATLGTLLNLAVPARKYSGDNFSKAVIMVFLWGGFTVAFTGVCRLSASKASLEKIAWVSLQMFSTLYVVAGLVNLVGGLLMLVPLIAACLVRWGSLGDSIAHNPVYIFFFVQFGLFNIYLPLAAKGVLGLSRGGCFRAIMFLSLFWVWFALLCSPPRHVHHFDF
jgi:hypothetical protein